MVGPGSSGVERVLGKDEVAGSNPVSGSTTFCEAFFLFFVVQQAFEIMFPVFTKYITVMTAVMTLEEGNG